MVRKLEKIGAEKVSCIFTIYGGRMAHDAYFPPPNNAHDASGPIKGTLGKYYTQTW